MVTIKPAPTAFSVPSEYWPPVRQAEELSDVTFGARIRAGDESAFATLFYARYDELVTYAARVVDDAAAEDVVQTVFVEIWNRHDTFNPPGSIRAFLYAAVRYRALDRRRGDRRAEQHAAEYGALIHLPEEPQEMIERQERDVLLRTALAQLAPRAREALLLVRDHGLTYQEAAAVMGVSVNTLKTQLSRAIAALRTLVGPLLGLVAFCGR